MELNSDTLVLRTRREFCGYTLFTLVATDTANGGGKDTIQFSIDIPYPLFGEYNGYGINFEAGFKNAIQIEKATEGPDTGNITLRFWKARRGQK